MKLDGWDMSVCRNGEMCCWEYCEEPGRVSWLLPTDDTMVLCEDHCDELVGKLMLMKARGMLVEKKRVRAWSS